MSINGLDDKTGVVSGKVLRSVGSGESPDNKVNAQVSVDEGFTAEELDDAVAGVASSGMTPEEIGETLQLSSRNDNTITLLGDSITAQNVISIGDYDSLGGRGYFTWANIAMKKPFQNPVVEGVGGERTDEILDRVTDVTEASPKPAWCSVLGGY